MSQELKAIEMLAQKIAALDLRMAALERTPAPTVPRGVGPSAVAPDHDLDGEHGNPVVHRDPPRWTGGGTYAGRHYSDCPPDYLEVMSGFLLWKAAKNDVTPGKEKYASYDRADSARALGWAARHRAGKTRPVVPASPDWDGDEDEPDNMGLDADDFG